jgi:hypothetical protein
MLSLQQIALNVGQKIGKTDADTIGKLKGFIRNRYQMIYDHALWKDSMIVMAPPDLDAGQDTVILPHYIERVIKVRGKDFSLPPAQVANLFRTDPTIFERTGSPLEFTELPPSATHTAPGGNKIVLYSSSAADTGITVSIWGEYAGQEVRETAQLAGGTHVTTAGAFDVTLGLAKPATAGNITILAEGSSDPIGQLASDETERKHPRLWLLEAPREAGYPILVMGKRRIRPLVNDNDSPLIRSIDNALMAFAQADALEYIHQYAKAQVKMTEGAALVNEAIKLERDQAGHSQRIIPRANFTSSRFLRRGAGLKS